MLRNKDPLTRVSVRTPKYNYVLDRWTGAPSLWRWDTDYRERTDVSSARDPTTQQQMRDLGRALAQFTYATTRTQSVSINPEMLPKTGSAMPEPSSPPDGL
jgi:hypothetical protein